MSAFADVLRTKLIPWTQHDASKRFIVVRPEMRESDMPPSARLTRRAKTGKRVVVKNRRNYSNVRNIVAEWPDDGLYELAKYSLICVLDGHIDFSLGNHKLQCGPKHFIFIPPGIPHSKGSRPYVDLEKSTSCDILVFLLHPGALECWMSHCHSQGREASNYCVILHDRVVSLFQALMEASWRKKSVRC